MKIEVAEDETDRGTWIVRESRDGEEPRLHVCKGNGAENMARGLARGLQLGYAMSPEEMKLLLYEESEGE